MQPFSYKKGLLRVAETWFQETPRPPDVDIVRCMQISAPIDGVPCDEFCTLVVDLSKAADDILANMDRGTRYEIRRAQAKDELHYEHWPIREPADMQRFLASYTANLASRNGALRVNRAKLLRLAESGQLDLSLVSDNRGSALTWHVHVLCGETARLLYSVSEASGATDKDRRNLCGRANRLHHWLDMQRFKGVSYGRYDFGGFYTGDVDAKKLKINDFKKGFGGQLIVTYNCVYPLTLRGRITLAAWRLLRRRGK